MNGEGWLIVLDVIEIGTNKVTSGSPHEERIDRLKENNKYFLGTKARYNVKEICKISFLRNIADS